MKITSTLLSTVSLYVLLGAVSPSPLLAFEDGEITTTTTTTVAAKDLDAQQGDDVVEETNEKPRTWGSFFFGSSTSDSDSEDEEEENESSIPNAAGSVEPQISSANKNLQTELEELEASRRAVMDATKGLIEEAKASPEGLKALLASVDLTAQQMDLTKSIHLHLEETMAQGDQNAAHQTDENAPVVSKAVVTDEDACKVLRRAEPKSSQWGWGSTALYYVLFPVAAPVYYLWGGSPTVSQEATEIVGGVASLVDPAPQINIPQAAKYPTDIASNLENETELPSVLEGVVKHVFEENSSAPQVAQADKEASEDSAAPVTENVVKAALEGTSKAKAPKKKLSKKQRKRQAEAKKLEVLQQECKNKEDEVTRLREMLQAITQNNQQK